MRRIGITGGMGSGKSTFCEHLRDLGAFVVDMDHLAKDVIAHSQEVRKGVIQIFGPNAFLDNGKLNRSFLASEAFGSEKLELLNQLVHPEVYKRLAQIDEFAVNEGVDVFIREAAIMLANGRPEGLDLVVLISAPVEERIRRVMQRDGSSREDILKRLSHQQTDEELMPMCDIVVHNTGDIDDLKNKAEELYHSWDG